MNRQILIAALHAKVSEQIERTQHLIHLLPENSVAWTPPIAGVWPVGTLTGHLLDCLAGFCAALHAAAPHASLAALRDLPVNHACSPAEATSRIAIYKDALDQSFAGLCDEQLGIPIPTVFTKNGELLLTLLLGNLEHLINHKHQLFTYLKMMGVSVGSADLYRFRE
ncbi:MAG: DinB family protein [Candidatus Solibacter sp.]